MAGISVIETLSYATYFIAARARPEDFPTSRKNLRKISPKSVAAALVTSFGDGGLGSELSIVSSSAQYRDWSRVRIILFHRSAPGRHISVTVGAPTIARLDLWDAGSNLVVNPDLTRTRRHWLATCLESLCAAELDFVKEHIRIGSE